MESPVTLSGTPVVPGVGHGPVVWPAPRPTPDRDAPPIDEADRDAAVQTYTDAAETVANRLRDRAALADGVAAEVLAATAGLATDRGLRQAVVERIGEGTPIDVAVADATQQFAEMFMQVGGVMAERVTDLKDLRDRVVAEVQGAPEPGIPMPDDPSVLLADDLAPADTAGLDATKIVALATELGGPTSHTAIIARQLGIPCVVAVAGLEELDPDVRVLVNGFTGEVVVDPDSDWADAQAEQAAEYAASIAAWSGPGATADGHAVALLANVGDGAAARAASAAVAEGVGLFRTELCFLGADTEPTVEEQAAIYAEVLAAFPESKVVVRTLDAGSDKPLKFAGMPDEPNPSLGVRGLRIAVAQPELLENQLDAIALAGEQTGTTPWVMAPMVATVAEAAGFAEKVRSRGMIPGVMVEVPATALLADAILAQVEFMSLGTNDLTQYIMAADRMAADLADLTDPWQPAVLQLVERTAQAGVSADKQVGVCGEAAADPILACVLVGMGVSTLSAASAALPAVGMRLGQVSLETCREAAAAALASTSAKEARAAARAVVDAATL